MPAHRQDGHDDRRGHGLQPGRGAGAVLRVLGAKRGRARLLDLQGTGTRGREPICFYNNLSFQHIF